VADKSWLDVLTESTVELEPPERFFWWSGLAAISAVVRKNVFLNRFSYILYPNIYVVLVSSKSGLRKGIPIGYARSIVKHLDCTRVVSGATSVPALLEELGNQRTTASGKVFSDAQAFICAPELDGFLVQDDKSLVVLTDIHNTHEHEDGYEKNLKSGRVFLKSPCITLLGASNEVLFEDFVRARDVEGGFLARTFIVHESKRRRNNSLMWKPDQLVERSVLAQNLERLVSLTGVFQIPEQARHHYNDWYNEISNSGFDDRTGSIERIGDQVLKVAMLVSLSKSNNLEITVEDLDTAIQRCEEAVVGTKKVSMGQGRSEVTPIVSEIIKLLVDAPEQEVERAKLLDKTKCEPLQLDRALDTLIQRDMIDGPFRKQGSKKFFYKMKKSVYEKYLKIREI